MPILAPMVTMAAVRLRTDTSRLRPALRGFTVDLFVKTLPWWRRVAKRGVPGVALPSIDSTIDRETAVSTLESIAEGVEGRVGFCAVHIESGRTLTVGDDRPFPMASLVKLPIALHTFRRVDAGERRLSDLVEVGPRHWRPGSGVLAQFAAKGPLLLPVQALLREMLQESDNTATDALLEWLGGPDPVRREMESLAYVGIAGPTRTIGEVLRDLHGLPEADGDPKAGWWRDLSRVSADAQRTASERFSDDPRDCARPTDMVALLRAIDAGEVLEEPSRRRLLSLLSRARTGNERLLAGLPKGTRLAHKTGTLRRRYAADAGVARLPDGTRLIMSGHVWSQQEDAGQVIAHLTRVAVAHTWLHGRASYAAALPTEIRSRWTAIEE